MNIWSRFFPDKAASLAFDILKVLVEVSTQYILKCKVKIIVQV